MTGAKKGGKARGVKEVYDAIAGEWAEYKKGSSRSLRHFISMLPAGCVALDAGCGSGRNIPEIAGRARLVYGVDFSKKLLAHAAKLVSEKKLGPKVRLLEGDVRSLPLASRSVDAVFSMAVLHHLGTAEDRTGAFREIRRVLKKGGLAFVTVWNKSQPRFRKVRGRDAMVPWTAKDGGKIPRYYHFFSPQELRALAEKTGLTARDVFFEKDGKRHAEAGAANLCAVLEKI